MAKNRTKSVQNDKSSNAPVPVTLASFWKRLFAWIYDLLGALGIFILALAVGELALYLITLPFVDNFSHISNAASKNPLWAIYLLACVQYYYVWCWVKGGQTVGMKAWKLQLYKANGQLLNWREAYVRSFFSLGGLANLWSLLDNENRGWHDRVVDSRVIQLPKDFYKKKNIDKKPIL